MDHVSRSLCVVRLLNVRLYFHLAHLQASLSIPYVTLLLLAPSITFELPDYKASQDRLPQLINSVNVQGHGVVPSMRVDVGAANSYTDEADEEDITTPVRPSEKAPDAEPDEGVLRTSLTGVPLLSFWLTRFHRRYS